jgi:hypothetical protein
MSGTSTLSWETVYAHSAARAAAIAKGQPENMASFLDQLDRSLMDGASTFCAVISSAIKAKHRIPSILIHNLLGKDAGNICLCAPVYEEAKSPAVAALLGPDVVFVNSKKWERKAVLNDFCTQCRHPQLLSSRCLHLGTAVLNSLPSVARFTTKIREGVKAANRKTRIDKAAVPAAARPRPSLFLEIISESSDSADDAPKPKSKPKPKPKPNALVPASPVRPISVNLSCLPGILHSIFYRI